ncbi:MAG TPA: glycerol-3-phosphate dehydrogenase/oxidase [Humisphaera sp.]|jgi:glycerol-3-phosphate dehydrogenase|nr:glycerol-3-phosphate dehydrogenase/oxidase [Humisphaera sp.]
MSSTRSRATQLANAQSEVLDLLVVGGGIVGSGIARDAALRGLRILVIDQHDFAFGTSSRSSRLLHGGLRYLAQGRLRLVREASAEKMILHRIAPHLAEPLPFIFPTYRGTEWKRWKLGIGVKIYDLLCGKSNLGKSSVLDRAGVLQLLPGLSQENLTGAVRYFDGFTNDARLVLDTLRSASHGGAMTLNYLALVSADRRDEVWHCELEDHAGGERVKVRARTVVNAAGAWAPGFAASRVKLRLTKGVHLAIDRERLQVPSAVVMTEGPRILFVIPWGQRIVLGTTDTDYDGPLDAPSCEQADLQYVLSIANRSFPSANLKPADVISAWAGLRPLIADPRGRPSDISRAHQIAMTEPGWLDVAGGKLTTYRLMAEQAVDHIVEHLGKNTPPCSTANRPILDNGLTLQFSAVVPPEPSPAAVEQYCRHEWAMHLDDVMIRRSGWNYYYHNRDQIAATVADQMAEILGWDTARREQELERYRHMTRGLAPVWESEPQNPGAR